MISKSLHISKKWSLFLDRDGVINRRLVDDYVKRPEDFVFEPGAPEAIKIFGELFGRIVVVTNQQGIGKGLMTSETLDKIHRYMLLQIENAGGRIDGIYYCPELRTKNPFCRKPQVGMALKARKDFPDINFKKSIMAGDSKSDMQFGKRLNMKTVLIGTNAEIAKQHPELVDFWFPTLLQFAKSLG
jgi:histidinol-phosphate phosphatase family protein